MSCSVTHADDVPAGRGPHPAASPFDKRVSEALGVNAFAMYQVELPPGASTEPHDHLHEFHRFVRTGDEGCVLIAVWA